MSVVSVLGTLADGVVGSADDRGLVRLVAAGIEVDWWVGADDGWVIPADGAAQTIRPGTAPAIESRVRVPGGEAVLRAYAVAGSTPPLVVMELDNASPAAVVIAWVVRAAPGYRIGRVEIDGSTLLIDQRARIALPGTPLRWSVARRVVGVRDAIVGGGASTGRFEPVVTRRGDLEVALLFPVAHRTRTRVAASVAAPEPVAVAPAALADLADVERGWVAALERGTQIELPDEQLEASVAGARASVLLGASGAVGRRRDRAVVAAAAAWGLVAAPERGRVRPAARGSDDPWPDIRTGAASAGSTPEHAAAWLTALRDALVRVDRDPVEVLPSFPVEWLGRPVALHDAPTSRGLVSFALRWHGPRPALLWDVPAGIRVRAPGLDPAWHGVASAGEALLAEIDPTRLLPMNSARPTADPGVAIDEPGSFT